MPFTSFEVKVPGKLFVAGEYAVTESGSPAIVIAVDRYIRVVISPSTENHLLLSQIGLDDVLWEVVDEDIRFSSNSPKLAFIRNAIKVFYQLLQEHSIEQRNFTLSVISELDDPSGKKYGLGSSAAVVVGVITALIHLYNDEKIPLDKKLIFKLAAISHFTTQGNGSCADIAASTYGGWLCYSSFDGDWLLDQLDKGTKIPQLLASEWPSLTIEPISPPDSLQLCVGWTGKSASTGPMVQQVHKLKEEDLIFYQNFLTKSRNAVDHLLSAFAQNDCDGAIAALRENRIALRELDEKSQTGIETEGLKRLIRMADEWGSGKSSGAGGGDCGIAFVRTKEDADRLREQWRANSIEPLDLYVAQDGAKVITNT